MNRAATLTELRKDAVAAGRDGLEGRVRVAVGPAIPLERRVGLAVRRAGEVRVRPERRDLRWG